MSTTAQSKLIFLPAGAASSLTNPLAAQASYIGVQGSLSAQAWVVKVVAKTKKAMKLDDLMSFPLALGSTTAEAHYSRVSSKSPSGAAAKHTVMNGRIEK